MSAPLNVDELLILGQLAGYSKAEVARMMLEADDAKRIKKQDQATAPDASAVCGEAPVVAQEES